VTTVYVLAPGTRVAISRGGGEFKPHKLRKQLQFSEPTETAETTMTFAEGGWQVRVDRAKVIVSHQQGGVGWNEFGV